MKIILEKYKHLNFKFKYFQDNEDNPHFDDCYINMAFNKDVIETIILMNELYEASDECGTGLYAHIVSDDGNLEDGNIDFCINLTLKNKENYPKIATEACLNYLNKMKTLNEEERETSYYLNRNYIYSKEFTKKLISEDRKLKIKK